MKIENFIDSNYMQCTFISDDAHVGVGVQLRHHIMAEGRTPDHVTDAPRTIELQVDVTRDRVVMSVDDVMVGLSILIGFQAGVAQLT